MFHFYCILNLLITRYILPEIVYYNIQEEECPNLLVYGYCNIRPSKFLSFIEWFAFESAMQMLFVALFPRIFFEKFGRLPIGELKF
jgi:hypothetical protein